MSSRRTVVLHVGMGKTGTSSLQATFNRNRPLLAERGILYPETPGKRRHIRLGLAMQPDPDRPRTSVDWRRQAVTTPGELRPLFEQALMDELSASRAPVVLLSDEALFGSEPAALRHLRGLLDRIAADVRVVGYLRRQDDHVISRYQQVVKRAGEVRRLRERVADSGQRETYDYHARLVAWRDLVRPDQLVVRTFEPARFLNGSLLEDFLDAAGLDLPAQDLAQVPNKNEGLDAEAVEFLRIRNLFHDERGEVPDLATTNRVVRRMERAAGGGPTLTLPPADLDRFMAQWESSNRAVARDFVPGAPELLFTTDRKSRNTTAEQRLDPVRVDHYVGVAGLPREMASPLRAIAESEAAAPE